MRSSTRCPTRRSRRRGIAWWIRPRALAETIHTVGVKPQGISLDVDQARAEAILAMQDLIDAVAVAEPTIAARSLGII